jgi:magnesium transporter
MAAAPADAVPQSTAFEPLPERDATTSVPLASRSDSAGKVRTQISGRRYDAPNQVVVLEDEVFAGVVPLKELLDAESTATMEQLMASDPPVFAPGTPHEPVGQAMVEAGYSDAVVVDSERRFVGVVPGHLLLRGLLAAHDEDLARLGGYLASTKRARLAAEEPVARRLWHRLPWLIVGLAGAMASAIIVGAFEGQLEEKVLLAFFLPAVVYMADAVGTQTETVLIRGFAAGIRMRDVIFREVVTGALIGAFVGAVFYPFAMLGWGDGDVALAVGLALFACCAIATTVATLLPTLLQRLGADPAFGSGPLATIIQDLLSIVVYLAIATPIAA